MGTRSIGTVVIGLTGCLLVASGPSRGDWPTATLDPSTRDRCLAVLRAGLTSEEFWPSMHAAEGLTREGLVADVRARLEPLLARETDDQRRCGLARELVRAGDLSRVRVILDVLARPDPYGHVHACESLFKVGQVGDGALLRASLGRSERPPVVIMAAAALARSGDREALDLLRRRLGDEDGATARLAAWALARMGGPGDRAALEEGARRFHDPLTRSYFEHALAALGDADGAEALVRNLGHSDPAIRVAAAEFASDARATGAEGRLVSLLDDPVLDVRLRAASSLLQLEKPPTATR